MPNDCVPARSYVFLVFLTILNVIWAPLMLLLPHDHNMWATIGIYTGREDNIIWQRRSGAVRAVGASSLCEREVFPLP